MEIGYVYKPDSNTYTRIKGETLKLYFQISKKEEWKSIHPPMHINFNNNPPSYADYKTSYDNFRNGDSVVFW
jgi:hypothetical protein